MRTKERIAVYAVLLMLGLLVLGSPLAGTVNAAGLLAELLGPTDGVALRQAEGSDVVLSAKGDRLSTGASPHAQVYQVGICDVVTVMERYMLQPEVVADLNGQFERHQQELLRQGEDLQKLKDAMEMTTDPAQRNRIAQQGQQLQQTIQQKQRQAYIDQNISKGEYMIEAYGKITAAIDTVAERLGADLVLTSRDSDLPITGQDPNQILTNILARTVVRFPGEIDLTEAVIAEMNLPEPPEPTTGADTAPAEGG